MDQTKVKEILEQAHHAVTEAGVPEGLQEVAFTKAVDLLAGQTAPALPQQQTGQQQQQQQQPAGNGPSLQKIATKLNLDLATVENIYIVEDGQLQVIVPTNRLATSARAAMRELIHVTAVGRQAGGWDTGASAITDVRAVCEHYGGAHYDANNFGNSVTDLRDYIRKTGTRNSATLRVLPGGYTEGANLVRRLAGQE
jgi:hypothetical protein